MAIAIRSRSAARSPPPSPQREPSRLEKLIAHEIELLPTRRRGCTSASSDVQRGDCLILEVDGRQDVVHTATATFLMVISTRASAAPSGTVIIAALYAAIAMLAFAGGNDVLSVAGPDRNGLEFVDAPRRPP